MNFRLVMNPGSKSGRGQRLWALWKAGLENARVRFDSCVTERPGDAIRITRESCDVDTVVAVGGDGTINEVLDGIIQSGNPHLKMGVLYSGTSPDFCRFHGIPTDPMAALRRLVEGRTVKVDAAQIEYSDRSGRRQIAHFACGCNIGMGAAIARSANRWRRYLGDAFGTAMAVIRAIVFSAPVDLDVEVDGVRQSLPRVNNLSILKNPYIASGLRINLDIKPDDGRMVLASVNNRSRIGLCTLMPGFYSGKAARANGVLLKHCQEVNIRSAGIQEIEFDGDPRGYLPAVVRVLPAALNLVGGYHE